MADLIAAIATPAVPSAIGILRLSGEGALEAAAGVFRSKYGVSLADCPDRQLIFGTVRDREGREIDQALATVSRAPHSYTGEDTAELQCHGSPAVLALALEALYAQGARPARPGEFTQRAFLNGKLDLVQSEAVIDLIEAETPAAVRQAAGQLEGGLSRQVEEIYEGLVDVLAHFHAVLDYPDEDIDPFREATLRQALDTALAGTKRLLATYHRGRQITYGVPTAILGRPNAGKSSLFNVLLGYQRAIVTAVPGTTRDTIQERVVIGGVLLRLTDTAGVRDTGDEVEQIGVERSREAAQAAQLALLVLDGSQPLTEEDREAMELAKQVPNRICVINKSDLEPVFDPKLLREEFPRLCVVSAAEGAGLDALDRMVAELFPTGSGEGGGVFLTNERQYAAAGRAKESLLRAREGLETGLPPDLLLTDVEEAMGALGELTGRTVREDVTARIFQRFCVGK